ncbi:cysteine desulfurase [Candidatus Saccharibacteria bacterium]|nr:cysteine desulfurase [Candidatus Saccharibacteria bacterium]
MIYFDSSATNPLLPEVRDEMLQVMNLSVEKELGNPSSLHSSGSLGRDLLDSARASVANLIDARKSELIFTSGGSESNNTVLRTFENSPILVSKIEHPSVLSPAEEFGNPCIKIPVDKAGVIGLNFLHEKLESLLKENPKQKVLVSVMLANNGIGTLEPIREIADLVKGFRKEGFRNLFLHSDATQAVGKIPVSVKDLGVDYLTFSSHKLGGPVGIGALFVRTGAPFRPLIFGGAQENKRRAGTSNAVLASGFRVAAENARKTPEKYKTVEKLRDYLATEIEKRIPTARRVTPLKNSLPNILNVSFPAAEGESTQLYLDLEKIAVSTGSACASGDLEPSHVLMALFGDAEVAHNSVRFSLNLSSTKAEVDELLEKLPPIIDRLQKISTIKLEK